MPNTKTLVIIKPDGISKLLIGNIISRFTETRLEIIGCKMVRVSKELAEKHYAEHKGKPFYNDLIDFITGKLHQHREVMALVYSGLNAIEKIRAICGATNPEKAEPDTIRGQFGRILESGLMENVVHASDSVESAEKEIKLWFEPDELIQEIYPTEEKVFKNHKKIVWKE
ncbi:MAG: nucleoside-diphosphate kinase [Spirochaetota bacterium]|nr:MAG: nucleoside-diphosphate kinase [Spirochaetota bacterium]